MNSCRRIAWYLALSALLSLILPVAGTAAPRGSRGSGRSFSGNAGRAAWRRGHSSGPISYNAYWRAANSPFPPSTKQDANRYWQKYQAWQLYHPQ
jgi:hypothetical protein